MPGGYPDRGWAETARRCDVPQAGQGETQRADFPELGTLWPTPRILLGHSERSKQGGAVIVHDPETDAESPAPLLITGPFANKDLHQIREVVRAHAQDWNLHEIAARTLNVVVTELVTNVILHGGGEGRLRLSVHEDSLYCQVADYGPGIARSHTAGWRPPSTADPVSSRGLWIVRMLCDHLVIDSSHIGTTVTARVSLCRTAAPGTQPSPLDVYQARSAPGPQPGAV
jgi:anti-sigma regulatory factor (Ser/Thr protein kinase)